MRVKIGVLVLFLFLIIFSLDSISGANSCDVRLRTDCNVAPWNNIVMGLYDMTNAHGELANQSNYNYVLCCDFSASNTCSGGLAADKIIGLSAATNAHAEVPSQTNYAYNVCYSNLNCISTTGTCSGIKTEVLSLSSQTNAHIGAPGAYSYKICCDVTVSGGGGSCQLTNSYWNTATANDFQPVRLLVEGTGCADGTSVTFDIGEVDGFGNPRTYNGNLDSADTFELSVNSTTAVFAGGIANASWIARFIHDDGLLTDENPEYVFKATLTNNASEFIDDSGELKVSSSINPNLDPIINITNIYDRGIYFVPNYLNFTQQSTDLDGTIPSITWEFGGSVTMQGLTGTFTTYTLSGSNITNSLNVSYTTPGQKIIRVTATDNQGGTGKDQKSILVLGSGDNILAYIATPKDYSTVSTTNLLVTLNAGAGSTIGSYLVQGSGNYTTGPYTLDCIAGACPSRSNGTVAGSTVSVTPAIFSIDSLSFAETDYLQLLWSFSGTTDTVSGRSNNSNITKFERKFSSGGDNWAEVVLDYYDTGGFVTSSSVRNYFTIVDNSQPLCVINGQSSEWIYPDGISNSSLENCEIPGITQTCCPFGSVCLNDVCVFDSDLYDCSSFDDLGEDACNSASSVYARQSIRDLRNDQDLDVGSYWDSPGYLGIPGCYTRITNFSCQWDDTDNECDALRAVESVNCGNYYDGICTYDQDSADDCEDGILTYSWTAFWAGSSQISGDCQDGDTTIVCPAKVKLPFFGAFQFTITIIVILTLYAITRITKTKKTDKIGSHKNTHD